MDKIITITNITTNIIINFCINHEYHDNIFYSIDFASWPQSTQADQQHFVTS